MKKAVFILAVLLLCSGCAGNNGERAQVRQIEAFLTEFFTFDADLRWSTAVEAQEEIGTEAQLYAWVEAYYKGILPYFTQDARDSLIANRTLYRYDDMMADLGAFQGIGDIKITRSDKDDADYDFSLTVTTGEEEHHFSGTVRIVLSGEEILISQFTYA